MKFSPKHIVAWLVFATISLFVRIAELKWQVNMVLMYEVYSKYFLAACLFYTSYQFIFKRYFERRKYFHTVILLLLLLILNGVVRHLLFSWVFVSLGFFPMYGYDFWQSFIIGIWWWYMFGLLAFGYYMLGKTIITERKLRIAETERLQLQNQKLQLQYNFLQAQINPHFLYNTLNFLYVEAEEHSEKLAEAIMALSGIMRYSIAEGAEKDTVPLEQEVEILDKYINLHQLRFNNQLNIRFKRNIADCNRAIPPYILITILENAFKHGTYGRNGELLYIELECTRQELRFIVENTVNPGAEKRPSSGVGLVNIAERLKLVYGEHQLLEVTQKDNIFSVRLVIQFSK